MNEEAIKAAAEDIKVMLDSIEKINGKHYRDVLEVLYNQVSLFNFMNAMVCSEVPKEALSVVVFLQERISLSLFKMGIHVQMLQLEKSGFAPKREELLETFIKDFQSLQKKAAQYNLNVTTDGEYKDETNTTSSSSPNSN